MGIGTSLALIAIGAILKWAVTATVSGISIATIGTILLIIGIIGLIVSLIVTMNVFGPRDRTVVRDMLNRRIRGERGQQRVRHCRDEPGDERQSAAERAASQLDARGDGIERAGARCGHNDFRLSARDR